MPKARDTYTHGHADSVLRSHRWRTPENSAAYLLPHLHPGQRLLDVGCGPGTLTAGLAALVAPGEVVGVDTDAGVVEEARAAVAERRAANVRLVAGDFRDAGFEPASFDVVHAHQVLQHLHDPVDALAAMAGLARPGGLVAVRDSDYPGFVWWPEDERLDRWLEVYLAVTRRNGARADAGRMLPSWAASAGLRDVTYTTSTWTFATPEERAWWGGLWAQRVTETALAEQAVAYGVTTPGELATVAQGWRDWAATDHAVFVVLHGELLATAQ